MTIRLLAMTVGMRQEKWAAGRSGNRCLAQPTCFSFGECVVLGSGARLMLLSGFAKYYLFAFSCMGPSGRRVASSDLCLFDRHRLRAGAASSSGPSAAPPPARAAQARPRARHVKRGDVWPIDSPNSTWSVARIWCNKTQAFTGWGATCKLHSNGDDKPGIICKKQLPYGKKQPISDAEAHQLVLAWLIAGTYVDRDSATGRSEHLAIQPRDLPLEAVAVLEQRAQVYWANVA